jgi:hypothetical protein
VRRNFADVDGFDMTRRCWDGSEPADREDDKGIGELVRYGGGNESAEELIFKVRGAGDGSDSGAGRDRVVGGAVNNKVRLKDN